MAAIREETILTLGGTAFVVSATDIAEYQADVLVNSAGTGTGGERGSVAGTVSAALHKAGGAGIFEELRAHEPLVQGDVIVTAAGSLQAKYIYHAVVVGWVDQKRVLQATIWRAVSKCIALAQLMGVLSIAFPSLGTGSGAADVWETHSTIAAACLDAFRSDGHLQRVCFSFLNPEKSTVFRRAFYQQQLIRELRGLSVSAGMPAELGAAFRILQEKLLVWDANINDLKRVVDSVQAGTRGETATYIVNNFGSGAVAVGNGAKAVAPGGVMVGGDNMGSINGRPDWA